MTTATVDAAAAPPAGPSVTTSHAIKMESSESSTERGPTTPAAPTASHSSPVPAATSRRRPPSRPAATADPLSDKATILLIRRTLCADETTSGSQTAPGAPASTTTASSSSSNSPPPLTDLLPPLTSRNDVDLQLYGLLAVIVREFVQTWYSRITPNGQLVREIVHIVAHCTRALEQRLRKVDLEGLLFDELPTLLDSHVEAYRIAHRRLVGHPVETDPRVIYHALIPLPFLAPVPVVTADMLDPASSEQAENEAAYRQLLVRGVLAVLLPTEDLGNDCLTDLVVGILADLLVGGVLARRVAEPWMMWEIIGMLARLVREKLDEKEKKEKKEKGKKAEKVKKNSTAPSSSSPSFLATISPLFWSTVRVGINICSSLRFLATSVNLARALPPRRPLPDKTVLPNTSDPLPPVLAYSLWPALANLTQLNVRMPWLSGGLSMLQWLSLTGPGHIGAFDGPLDRLLSHYLCKYALDPDLLPTLLRATRAAVFPGNKFGATPPTLVAPANETEEAALRWRTAEAVWRMVHGSSEQVPSDDVLADIEGVLDLFADPYCNKHLLYGVLEAILVRLVPEMAETGVLGLWGERLS